MSKSDPSDLSRINITDSPDDIVKKIRKAKTDPEPLPGSVEELRQRPEAENLVGIYAALAGTGKAEIIRDFAGRPFSDFKPALADLAVEKLAPINSEMRRLMSDPGHVDAILADGAARARAIAEQTMREVRSIVGFIQ
jgi:tryptophanyl-tRNA synthetase